MAKKREWAPLKSAARFAFIIVLFCAAGTFAESGKLTTIELDVQLRTGGGFTAIFLDHTEHALAVLHDKTPYVFAWTELKPGSAYTAKAAIVALQRGGYDRLEADDHRRLGEFALEHGRADLARLAFERAAKMDRSGKTQRTDNGQQETGNGQRATERIANDELRIEKETRATDLSPRGLKSAARSAIRNSGFYYSPPSHPLFTADDDATLPALPDETREAVMNAYRKFGEKVQDVFGRSVTLVESDHFLIWTDWERPFHDQLVDWAESVYRALLEQFGLDPSADLFLAKSPMFFWRSRARFLRFARDFDGHDATDSVGYTRSIERNGHVHVVLLRQGRSAYDLDRFACTLVHEATHAFVHRLYTTRLIPHWINEGFADLMAHRVLPNRCPTDRKADLLAEQFVRFDWPVAGFLENAGPIEVHQYPLAQSVVAFLERRSRRSFAGFIRDLKHGASVAEALAGNYDGMDFSKLEALWRQNVRDKVRRLDHASPPSAHGSASEIPGEVGEQF